MQIVTGKSLQVMFIKELRKIPHGGAEYFRNQKAFEKVAELLNKGE